MLKLVFSHADHKKGVQNIRVQFIKVLAVTLIGV